MGQGWKQLHHSCSHTGQNSSLDTPNAREAGEVVSLEPRKGGHHAGEQPQS